MHETLPNQILAIPRHQIWRYRTTGAKITSSNRSSYQTTGLYSLCLFSQRKSFLDALLETHLATITSSTSHAVEVSPLRNRTHRKISPYSYLKRKCRSTYRNSAPFRRHCCQPSDILCADQRRQANEPQRAHVGVSKIKPPAILRLINLGRGFSSMISL